MCNQRYVNRRSYRSRVTTFVEDLSEESVTIDNLNAIPFAWLNEDEFLQQYRMNRASFYTLVEYLRVDPIFCEGVNRNGPAQRPVEHQVLVFLKYLGTEGSGGSNPNLRCKFNIGRGTAEIYKQRVCIAIRRQLRERAIQWPSTQERLLISQRIHNQFALPNCVGFIDGTLLPLTYTPTTHDAPDYYGRKGGYTLSTMIVCDDRRRITYYTAGWPGCAHDNRIFRNMDIWTRPLDFFSQHEYILGDSAFDNNWFVSSCYKKPFNTTLSHEEEMFNQAVSKARIAVEHTIGLLKGRFPWLRKITAKVTEDLSSMQRILEFIDCCVILHNLLQCEWGDKLPNNANIQNNMPFDKLCRDAEHELNLPVPQNANKDTRRQQLTNYVVDNYVFK
jgi:hypothetical protein